MHVVDLRRGRCGRMGAHRPQAGGRDRGRAGRWRQRLPSIPAPAPLTSMLMLHTSFSTTSSSCGTGARRWGGGGAGRQGGRGDVACARPAPSAAQPLTRHCSLSCLPASLPSFHPKRTSTVSSPSSALRLLCILTPNSLRITGSPLGPSCSGRGSRFGEGRVNAAPGINAGITKWCWPACAAGATHTSQPRSAQRTARTAAHLELVAQRHQQGGPALVRILLHVVALPAAGQHRMGGGGCTRAGQGGARRASWPPAPPEPPAPPQGPRPATRLEVCANCGYDLRRVRINSIGGTGCAERVSD